MIKKVLLSILLLITITFANSEPVDTGTLVITITGIEEENGVLMVGLFTESDEFLETPSFPKEIKIINKKSVTIIMENIPYGLYAISIFHDLNGNKELDTNFIRIPKEPFGFSNNYMPKFGPPSFKGASFVINEPKVELSIKMKSF